MSALIWLSELKKVRQYISESDVWPMVNIKCLRKENGQCAWKRRPPSNQVKLTQIFIMLVQCIVFVSQSVNIAYLWEDHCFLAKALLYFNNKTLFWWFRILIYKLFNFICIFVVIIEAINLLHQETKDKLEARYWRYQAHLSTEEMMKKEPFYTNPWFQSITLPSFGGKLNS